MVMAVSAGVLRYDSCDGVMSVVELTWSHVTIAHVCITHWSCWITCVSMIHCLSLVSEHQVSQRMTMIIIDRVHIRLFMGWLSSVDKEWANISTIANSDLITSEKSALISWLLGGVWYDIHQRLLWLYLDDCWIGRVCMVCEIWYILRLWGHDYAHVVYAPDLWWSQYSRCCLHSVGCRCIACDYYTDWSMFSKSKIRSIKDRIV